MIGLIKQLIIGLLCCLLFWRRRRPEFTSTVIRPGGSVPTSGGHRSIMAPGGLVAGLVAKIGILGRIIAWYHGAGGLLTIPSIGAWWPAWWQCEAGAGRRSDGRSDGRFSKIQLAKILPHRPPTSVFSIRTFQSFVGGSFAGGSSAGGTVLIDRFLLRAGHRCQLIIDSTRTKIVDTKIVRAHCLTVLVVS